MLSRTIILPNTGCTKHPKWIVSMACGIKSQIGIKFVVQEIADCLRWCMCVCFVSCSDFYLRESERKKICSFFEYSFFFSLPFYLCPLNENICSMCLSSEVKHLRRISVKIYNIPIFKFNLAKQFHRTIWGTTKKNENYFTNWFFFLLHSIGKRCLNTAFKWTAY